MPLMIPDNSSTLWIWHVVIAQVIDRNEDYGIIYARLLTDYCHDEGSFTVPEPERIVSCQIMDHLNHEILNDKQLILLEVNERNGSYSVFGKIESYSYWSWHFAVGEVIGEGEDDHHRRVLYARLVSHYCDFPLFYWIPKFNDMDEIVTCQINDGLIHEDEKIKSGSVIYLKVDEEYGSYTCYEIHSYTDLGE